MPASSVKRVSAEEGYRHWAPLYDAQPNPLTHLERRVVSALLPSLSGKNVIDLGCGTGRWVKYFLEHGARSVVGVDSSAAMLERAERELRDKCRFFHSDCCAVPAEIAPARIIIASFLLSYLPSLSRLAAQFRQLVQPNSEIFLTDVHPATQRELGWSRGFRLGETRFEFQTTNRPLQDILDVFDVHGFQADVVLEPAFAEPERVIFATAGKLADFDECSRFPAIYVVRFRPKRATGSPTPKRSSLQAFRRAQLGLDGATSVGAELQLADGRISRLQSHRSHERAGATVGVDLSGYLLLPGLINSHDHLEFALFPRLGGGHYANSSQWASSIYKPEVTPVREHRAVPKRVRLWWGGLRNLLSGVTTVCHHNPFSRTILHPDFPVRVVRDFDWAHSLLFDRDAVRSLQTSHRDRPFVIHAAEGTDHGCAEELLELDRMGVLNANTVIVHGIGAGPEGRDLLRLRHASLVWCPTSNCFLFGRTHTVEELGQLGRVVLGTDSSLTAAGDMLDEIRFAHESGMDAQSLYRMVSTASAESLQLPGGEGTLRPGAWADVIALRDRGVSPADAIVNATFRDVELATLAGRVQLASSQLMERLPSALTSGMQLLDVAGVVRWVRAPLRTLFREAIHCLGSDLKLNGKPIRSGKYAA